MEPIPQSLPPVPVSNSKLLLILTGLVLALSSGAAGFFLGKQLYSQPTASQFTPLPSVTSVEEGDPTADWQMYTNIKYNYSIKYPLTLKTQILAAGAGNKEASANSDHIFVYNSSSQEPYLERYIEIQPFGQATSYGPEWQRFDIEINGISAAKFTNPNPNTFIIYRVAIPNTPGELEIMVTKDSRRSALADQILSTFGFVE